MKQKISAGILTIVCTVLLQACAPNPYAGTNKSYKKQVKAYAKLLREYRSKILSDYNSLRHG
ncbi:MAG TPA: hypothetical protein VJU78_05915 [Chitinophagaceae bacterium]|nr:hypothetical protein [Chitinophagaceae bacterium]